MSHQQFLVGGELQSARYPYSSIELFDYIEVKSSGSDRIVVPPIPGATEGMAEMVMMWCNDSNATTFSSVPNNGYSTGNWWSAAPSVIESQGALKRPACYPMAGRPDFNNNHTRDLEIINDVGNTCKFAVCRMAFKAVGEYNGFQASGSNGSWTHNFKRSTSIYTHDITAPYLPNQYENSEVLLHLWGCSTVPNKTGTAPGSVSIINPSLNPTAPVPTRVNPGSTSSMAIYYVALPTNTKTDGGIPDYRYADIPNDDDTNVAVHSWGSWRQLRLRNY